MTSDNMVLTLIALVESGHETTPPVTHTPPRGVLVSFEVDNAATGYEEAKRLGCVMLVELASPELVEAPAGHVVLTQLTGETDDLARMIRRAIQQLGRRLRQRDGVRCRSFSARFPVNVDDGPLAIEVAGHLDRPTGESIIQPAETHLKVLLVGNIALLPLAYDVALTAVHERGLQPCGTAIEHYLDLSAVGRTEVAIPVRV